MVSYFYEIGKSNWPILIVYSSEGFSDVRNERVRDYDEESLLWAASAMFTWMYKCSKDQITVKLCCKCLDF